MVDALDSGSSVRKDFRVRVPGSAFFIIIVSDFPPLITSSQNPLVKQIRRLHRTKGRREQNRLLLEGTHLLETALHNHCSLDLICYTEDWHHRHQDLWLELEPLCERLILVSPDVLQLLATTVNPDGIVATIAPDLVSHLPSSPPHLGLVLERLQDPGNLGTIFRTAVATGVDGLWLSPDCVDWDNPKVLRASAGAVLSLPKQVAADLPTLIQEFKSQGRQIIATVPQATKTYWELDFSRPSVLIFGNEGQGLSPDLIALADEQVTIPQSQAVESLNVAIAVALVLYEAQRQKHYRSQA